MASVVHSMRRLMACRWTALAALTWLLAPAAGVAACDLRIDSGWVRLPAPGSTTVAAYARISNTGKLPRDIVGIDTPIANMSHLHETQLEGSVAKMRAISQFTVPAGASIELSPGGRHIMMLGVVQRLKIGDQIRVNITDSSGCSVAADFPVLAKAPP